MMFSNKKASCFLVFLCLGVLVCEGTRYPPAPNCARYECPPYNVVYADKVFEIRSYDDAQWVSSENISSKSYTEGSNKGFLSLFAYYNGLNRKSTKIDMTTPVLVDILNSTYTVYFYLPKAYQKVAPPEPSWSKITQVKLPKYKYAAVRRYGGFISEKNIAEEVASLKKGLRGTPYERAAELPGFTVAGYNSPFEFTKRVNEVFLWFD